MELRRRLCPYLSIDHPTKGVVLGPYSKLPIGLKRTFLQVVWVLSGVAKTDDDLDARIARIVVGTEEEDYWMRLKPEQTRV